MHRVRLSKMRISGNEVGFSKAKWKMIASLDEQVALSLFSSLRTTQVEPQLCRTVMSCSVLRQVWRQRQSSMAPDESVSSFPWFVCTFPVNVPDKPWTHIWTWISQNLLNDEGAFSDSLLRKVWRRRGHVFLTSVQDADGLRSAINSSQSILIIAGNYQLLSYKCLLHFDGSIVSELLDIQ